MTFDISLIFQDTIKGIIIQLPIFILIWISAKMISRRLKIIGEKIPHYIEKYFKLRENQIRLEKAARL